MVCMLGCVRVGCMWHEMHVIYEAMVLEGCILYMRDMVCIWGSVLACVNPSVIFCP